MFRLLTFNIGQTELKKKVRFCNERRRYLGYKFHLEGSNWEIREPPQPTQYTGSNLRLLHPQSKNIFRLKEQKQSGARL